MGPDAGTPPATGRDGRQRRRHRVFKARLQILGVIREDVGTGRDYKAAATDAFKRAAVRFGIAHELYAYEQNWVQVDGDGRYAKPLEDPGVVYARRFGATNGAPIADNADGSALSDDGDGAEKTSQVRSGVAKRVRSTAAASATEPPADEPIDDALSEPTSIPSCPKCEGRMWDNRLSKRNPKAPDFKCRDRSCDGVIWPARANGVATPRDNSTRESREAPAVLDPSPLGASLDDLPF